MCSFKEPRMKFSDFMNKVRHMDNVTARWLMRHFYFTFFQFVLIVIFIVWFINTLHLINVSDFVNPTSVTERLFFLQTTNTILIVFLILLNSFWLLFIFNGLQRMLLIMKDVYYAIYRLRGRGPKDHKS